MKIDESHQSDRRGWQNPMHALIGAVLVFLSTAILSCSTIDCPFNNHVYTKYKLAGDVAKLSDQLSISTTRFNGNDSVIINSITGVDSFMLPMSYNRPEDVLYFHRTAGGLSIIDTVSVKKEDIPHFESIDCNPAYFHRIQSIRYTHHGIDSIVIKNTNVTYDESKTHFQIYFKILDQ